MKYFVYQGNDHDCGFASLKMLLAHLAKDKSYLYVPKPAKREKYNINDLINFASEYGVNLEASICDESYYDEIKNLCLTLIDENHVVLIKKKTKRHIIVYDPDKGKVKILKEEFLRRWRKIVVEKVSDELPFKLKKIRKNLTSHKAQIFEIFSALFSSGILIASLYLLNSKENYIFSFLFLCLFIAFQLLDKFILYKQVYTFDKKYIPLYMEAGKEKNKIKYQNYIKFKEHYFTTKRGLISAVLVAFLITFLLCFNDFRNVFVLLALILVKLIEVMFMQKTEEHSKNKIAELESLSFNEDNEASSNALKANLMADTHILLNSFKDVFYIFLSFAFALIMLFVTGNTGCNFVIFHFILYFEGANSYNQLINGLSLRKESKKLEARFFDSCNL